MTAAKAHRQKLEEWYLVALSEGLSLTSTQQEDAKKLVKKIKDSGLKVQASIMDDVVRVTGKKIDDLQEVIQASKTWDMGLPLQFENMRS